MTCFIRFAALPLVILAWLAASLDAAEHQLSLSVSAGKQDRINSPAKAVVQIPAGFDKNSRVMLTDEAGKNLPGQLSLLLDMPGVAAKSENGKMFVAIHFILPELAAGKQAKYGVTISTAAAANQPTVFKWTDTPGQHSELALGSRPVLRYMYAPLDESSPEARSATFKPYHHVFDPETGTTLLTKGPGGLFPHHRGVFFGFNRISYGEGKTADVWHCNQGEFQSHDSFLETESGPLFGRHHLAIAWHGKAKDIFAEEIRSLMAYNLPGGTLVEFRTQLATTGGKVKLDGDPQHAGFQFRATQEVPDKTAKETYYLRPDGKGEPEKFRNWDDKGRDPKTVNLPWNALCMVVGGKRYTVCYLDRPDNPKESRFSERDYGRFGSYFEYELDHEKPLHLNYRLWIQAGEMTAQQVQKLADDFVHPAEVTLAE